MSIPTHVRAAQAVRIGLLVEMAPAQGCHVRVVVGHVPFDQCHPQKILLRRCLLVESGVLNEGREHVVVVADPDHLADAPHGAADEAVSLVDRAEFDHRMVLVGRVEARRGIGLAPFQRGVAGAVVQEAGVVEVRQVVQHLQVVAGMPDREGLHEGVGLCVGVVHRELGHFVGRSQIGEDQALMFEGRVGAVHETFLEVRVARLARCLKNAPIHVEQPAMVAAT